MADTLDSFDVLLDENEDGSDPHGFLVSWEGGDDAFVLQIDEQSVPASVVGDQEDENYGFRDLQDTWRASFSNFSGGEGQLRRDVSGGSLSKYHSSQFVDNSVEGSLRLHHGLRILRDELANFSVSRFLSPTSTAIEWQGYVACICNPYNTALNQHHRQVGLFDPQNPTAYWQWVGQKTDPLTAACDAVAIATDGEKLYVLYANGDATQAVNQGLWEYTSDDIYGVPDIGFEVLNGTQLANTATIKTVTDMVFSGGFLYLSAATSDGAKLGYYSDAAAEFVALSPDALISPVRTCFGLATVGTWVYWGVTNGFRSWVYAGQYDASTGMKHFQQFVELPSGFVGKALVSDLEMLFICGGYVAEDADPAQGAVFVANQNGVSRLCTIGDDPNETDDPGADVNRNRVIAGHVYDHWLYLLTERSLYRWDLRKGGLNHVAETGTFSASGGNPGSLLSIPWNTTYSYWPDDDYVHDNPLTDVDYPGLSGVLSSNNYPDDVKFSSYTEESVTYWNYASDTKDLHGDDCWAIRGTSGTTYGNFSSGGCVEFTIDNIREDAFGVFLLTNGGGTSATRRMAMLQLRGRTSLDQISVYYMDSVGNKTFLCDVAKRDDPHTFFFSADDATSLAKLWCDDQLLGSWTMCQGEFTWTTPLMGYCFGGQLLNYYSGVTRDWQVSLRYIRWAAGTGYDPTWVSSSGAIASCRFTVLAGSPYIVSAQTVGSSASKGLMAFDFSDRAESGWLRTSDTALRMPTVAKTATTLEVAHEPTDAASTITASVFVDDIYAGQLLVPAGTEERLSQAQLATKGYRLRCELALTGDAVVHGASVSFTPVDNSFYQMRLDLRDERRDNHGHDVLLADKVAWLLDLADSKRIVWLTTPYERVRVRVALLSFSGRAPQLDSRTDVQGIVTVRFKRLPT